MSTLTENMSAAKVAGNAVLVQQLVQRAFQMPLDEHERREVLRLNAWALAELELHALALQAYRDLEVHCHGSKDYYDLDVTTGTAIARQARMLLLMGLETPGRALVQSLEGRIRLMPDTEDTRGVKAVIIQNLRHALTFR